MVNDKLHLRNECEADKQDKQEYHLNYHLNPPMHLSLAMSENQRQLTHFSFEPYFRLHFSWKYNKIKIVICTVNPDK